MAINGIKEIAINSTNYLIEPTLYTTVEQESAATAFTADLANFELFTGVTVAVKFGVTNNDNATLNINETGGKAIYYEGAAIEANKLKANHTYIFTYNGAQWELVGDLDTNTQSAYGNITTDGKIGTTANLAVYTTTGGLITADTLKTDDPTADGTSNTFIASIEQDSKGKISATKSTVSVTVPESSSVSWNSEKTIATVAGTDIKIKLPSNPNSNTIPSAYCTVAGADKTASCTNYILLDKSWIHVLLTTNNTAKSALTLNINNKGAKPIFINGVASSDSNYDLKAGSYLVFYDGTNYYFRTDGKLPGDIAGSAASLTNFVISKYTLAPGKGVRIKYPSHAPVLISCSRPSGNSRLVLIGGGYGIGGATRNDFTEVVSPSESHFTWSLPQSLPQDLDEEDEYKCTIEIMHHDASSTATVWVETTEECDFKEISTLTSPKTNRTLLHSSNYTDYAVAKTNGVTAVTWDNNKLTRTINGSTADVVTADTLRTVLGLSSSSTDNAIVRFNGAEGAIQDSGIIIDDNNNLTIPGTLIKFTGLGKGLEFTNDQNYFGTDKDARIIQIVNTNAAAGSATVDGGLIIRAVGRNDSTDTVQELLRIRNHEGTTDWASGEFQWKTKDIVVETGDSKHWNIIAKKAFHATAAHWYAQSRHSTGVLKVKIKEKKAWMLTFTIRVYQGYKYDDYVISGYNYNTRHWTSYNVVLLGSSETDEHFVAFGYDDDANTNGYCTLWVAIPAGDYTGIDIFNVTNGHNQISDFSNLFEIVYEETNIDQLSGVQQTKSCFRPWYRDETVDAANTATYLQGTVAYSGQTVGETALTTNPGLGRIQYFHSVNSKTTGLFPHSNNANGLLTINTYAQSTGGDKYIHQLGFSGDNNLYHRAFRNQDIDKTTSWKQIAYTDSNITGSAASWTAAQTAYVQLSNASTTTTINGGQSTAQVLGVNGILPITNGGTGAGTISAARANLGLGNGKMFYAVCTTAADAADKVAVCAEFNKDVDFVAGTIVSVYFENKNSAAVGSLTLTIAQDDQGTNSTTAAPMKHIYNTSGLTNLTGASQLAAGSVIPFIYTGAVWQVIGLDYNNTYTLTEVWSNTSATAAAKVGGNGQYYYIQNPDDATSVNKHYFEMTLRYANTKAAALTLNINSQGAKPIYINGNPSSSDNYILPRGKYFVYYDGEHYNFRTDGIIPGKVERALADGNGDNIAATYLKSSNAATTYLKSSNFSTTNFNITTTNDTTIIGLKVAAYDTLGVVKPAFSNTSSITLSASSYTKTGISINSRTSVSGRYYGVEADANGRLYVNIPWEEYDNTIQANYSRSNNRSTYSRKMYMIGELAAVTDISMILTDSSTGEVSHSFDPYIYATTTTGELSATSHALNVEGVEKAHITYNTTDDSIDFIFN